MSGVNTKDSKINRMLSRQTMIDSELVRAFTLLRLNYEGDTATIKLLTATTERLSNSLTLATETAHRLEAENGRLRKYLGSVLFERRKREMQIPTLVTHVHHGSTSLPIPHTSTETV